MTATQIITILISISVSLLIAIFRNLLAKLGDTIEKRAGTIGQLVLRITWLTSGFIYPIVEIYKTYYTTFNKEWVTNIVFFSLAFFFNIIVLMLMSDSKMNEKLRQSQKNLLEAKIDKLKVEMLVGRIEDIQDGQKKMVDLLPKLTKLNRILFNI